MDRRVLIQMLLGVLAASVAGCTKKEEPEQKKGPTVKDAPPRRPPRPPTPGS